MSRSDNNRNLTAHVQSCAGQCLIILPFAIVKEHSGNFQPRFLIIVAVLNMGQKYFEPVVEIQEAGLQQRYQAKQHKQPPTVSKVNFSFT